MAASSTFRVAGYLLVVASLICPLPGRAMFVSDYDQLPLAQKDEFTDFLLNSVIAYLKGLQRTADADKLVAFFAPSGPDPSKGADLFNEVLDISREQERRHKVDKQGRIAHYRVEEAMSVVLDNAGIKVPLHVIVDLGTQYQQKHVPATQPAPAATAPSTASS